MRFLDREDVKQPPEVVGPIADREGIGWIVRRAGSGRVPCHDPEGIREIVELRVPRTRIAQEAVEEDDGGTLALVAVEDGPVVDFDAMYRRLAHRSPSINPAATSGGFVSCNRAACCSASSRIPSSSGSRRAAPPIPGGNSCRGADSATPRAAARAAT